MREAWYGQGGSMSHGDKRVVVEMTADEMGLLKQGMKRNLEVECFKDNVIFVMLGGSGSRTTVSDSLGVINDMSGQNVCGIFGWLRDVLDDLGRNQQHL